MVRFGKVATYFILGAASCNVAAFTTPSSRLPSSSVMEPLSSTDMYQKEMNKRSSTELKALPAAAAAITGPIGSVSVLAFVILIHELGHFLAARSLNISVKEFSVGVGPKLAGFTRKTGTETDEDDEGIEFNLRAIPLGGYVRFPENYNTTLEYQLEMEVESKRKEIADKVKEIREQNSEEVSNAGILSAVNIGLFSSIAAMKKPTKEERLLALEAMAINLNKKEEKTTGNWFQNLFSGNQSPSPKEENKRSIVIEEDGTVTAPEVDYYSDPDLLQNRPWAQRALVLVGGVVFNIILAFTLYFGELTIGNGLQKPSFGQGALVTSVARANSAGAGILDKGDVIVSLNGKQLTSTKPTLYESQNTISDFISSIRATNPGDALHLEVLKASTKKISEVDIKPSPMNDKEKNSPLSIGLMIAPNFVGNELMKSSNPVEAAAMASSEVSELATQTAKSILKFLGGLVMSGGNAPAGQQLSGPIGVLKTGSDVVKTNDIAAVVGFAAAISVNLAVVNALPLPALDGGQLVFVISEALTGKKVDQRRQEEITAFALFFLLLVSAGTAVGDVSNLLK